MASAEHFVKTRHYLTIVRPFCLIGVTNHHDSDHHKVLLIFASDIFQRKLELFLSRAGVETFSVYDTLREVFRILP